MSSTSGAASVSETGRNHCPRHWFGHLAKDHKNNWYYSCAAKCSSDSSSYSSSSVDFDYDWRNLEQEIIALVLYCSSGGSKEDQRVQHTKVPRVDEEP